MTKEEAKAEADEANVAIVPDVSEEQKEQANNDVSVSVSVPVPVVLVDEQQQQHQVPELLKKAKKKANAKTTDSGEEEEDEEETDMKDKSSNNFATSSLVNEDDLSNEPYVNQGFMKWQEVRTEWLASCVHEDGVVKEAVPLDVDEIIDLIFSHRWRAAEDGKSCFPQSVPLPQMVDILVDLWEAEGLDI